MPNRSKTKGNAYEHELVRIAKAHGLTAVRAYASNGVALGEVKECDLKIAGQRIQAKRRAKLPEWAKLDDGVDAVAWREDHGRTYVLITLEQYLEMLAGRDG